jgi:cell division protein FtsW
MFIGRVKTKHLLSTIGLAAIPVVILLIISMAYYDKEEAKCKDLPAILEIGRTPTWIKRVQNFVTIASK